MDIATPLAVIAGLYAILLTASTIAVYRETKRRRRARAETNQLQHRANTMAWSFVGCVSFAFGTFVAFAWIAVSQRRQLTHDESLVLTGVVMSMVVFSVILFILEVRMSGKLYRAQWQDEQIHREMNRDSDKE